ncbi:helix-turn-helix domain-containing protein [Limosilactobacillus mucosae]|uniref:Helix-turn-helix transcriptional regulator n=1 Tax=Limosilactobacillus mucosae TaxID=97478 RepID=A0AAJ1M7T9_LIMMU|nr:helix-turn-helix transcriptional regulator [Limosilactobacillus mucosae]MDC2828432.1 helix-turn-helix transcriptional regulator [Limosilactobacillus mucosae]MDC2834330.1 helix-turn-helix transcriptional regulator [Limosilactobacillus mucosae]
MERFQLRLLEALEEKGISQAELSRRTGISRSSISKYLKGTFKAKPQHVQLLAPALGVSYDWLICRSDNKQSDSNAIVEEVIDQFRIYQGKAVSDTQINDMRKLLTAYLSTQQETMTAIIKAYLDTQHSNFRK